MFYDEHVSPITSRLIAEERILKPPLLEDSASAARPDASRRVRSARAWCTFCSLCRMAVCVVCRESSFLQGSCVNPPPPSTPHPELQHASELTTVLHQGPQHACYGYMASRLERPSAAALMERGTTDWRYLDSFAAGQGAAEFIAGFDRLARGNSKRSLGARVGEQEGIDRPEPNIQSHGRLRQYFWFGNDTIPPTRWLDGGRADGTVAHDTETQYAAGMLAAW